MRMRFIARQTRREITAIVLLISEYHNVHLTDDYNYPINRDQLPTNISEDAPIEMPTTTYGEESTCNYSTSFENLKDDQLLTSDIQDLHALINEELQQMRRALTEISFEPYFLLLKTVNLIRKILRLIPCLKKWINAPSTLDKRLAIWATGLTSLQRTITGMLSLDHHHHAFVGQRQLINVSSFHWPVSLDLFFQAICLLLDSTFNFLDVTIAYTTSSSLPSNTAQIITHRAKLEEGLEHFFETYAQVRENSRHSNMSNTDCIRLNTFLLLILRLVHVTITAAETSETPGARLDIGLDQSISSSSTCCFNLRKIVQDLADYIGLKPSVDKVVRAVKTSLSVLVSAVVVLTFREHLQAYGWVYWAPMTTALVSDSSEGGTLRLSFQRLLAVLLGSTYAYIIVLVTQDSLAVGIFICLFVGLMGYVKTDSRKEYFASVCAQSASIITFISNREGTRGSNKAVLARTSLTFLGIFIHVFISNLLFPISARALIKKKVTATLVRTVIAMIFDLSGHPDDPKCFFFAEIGDRWFLLVYRSDRRSRYATID